MPKCDCPDHLHNCAPPDHQRQEDGLPEPVAPAGTSNLSARWRRWSRYFFWWLIFSGIYASSSVCPFCGRVGCPVGGASAGVVGGLFAFLMPGIKRFMTSLKRPFLRGRARLGPRKSEP